MKFTSEWFIQLHKSTSFPLSSCAFAWFEIISWPLSSVYYFIFFFNYKTKIAHRSHQSKLQWHNCVLKITNLLLLRIVLKFVYYLGFPYHLEIAKIEPENLWGLFLLCFIGILHFYVEVLWGQPGLLWLYQFHYIAKFFSELCISLISFCGFIRAKILLAIFEANTNFHREFLLLLSPDFTHNFIFMF